MEKPDLPACIRLWKGYFEKLLQLAEKQKEELEHPEIDWERIAEHSAEISRIQQLAEETCTSLKEAVGGSEYDVLFRNEVYSIAVQAQSLIEEVIQATQIRFKEVGTDLRHTREHQKLNRAYYGMDRDYGSAYYFDAKK